MKKIIGLISITALLTMPEILAQSAYKITPGSKGNEIIFSLVNESKTCDAEVVNVALMNIPRGIEVCRGELSIADVKKGEEKEVVFIFDAKRIPAAQKDTLKFQITAKRGILEIKEIILEYTLPEEMRLEQNYPNPFNPVTVIEFGIAKQGKYNLSIYNLLGQLIDTISDQEYQPGYFRLNYNASKLSSGIYIYKLSGENSNMIRKMMLLK